MTTSRRRLLAEFLGTGLLVAVVVGSGIAAQQMSPHDVGLQLLQNSLTTMVGLAVLILLFGPVSGAYFNPLVSAVDWAIGPPHPCRSRAVARGDRRHQRTDRGHPHPRPHRPRRVVRGRGRLLDRGGLLVHLVNLVRQPRRGHRPQVSDAFAGINPASVPLFIAFQILATGLVLVLCPDTTATPAAVGVPPIANDVVDDHAHPTERSTTG